ncbi:MAG: efflux transporter periplasmic adaptor subunit [Desulfuromusa sp.]|nr:efflux transporter periplasmic adaptor subunit [Desulfuromusa sp.]
MMPGKEGMKPSLWKKTLGILPVIIAILIIVVLFKAKTGPQKREISESSRTMRVIQVTTVDLVPRVIGYGTAEPGSIWRAVTEVKGRVVEVHQDLKGGALLQEGTVLLKIDPTEYELAVASLSAGIDQVKADLTELQAQNENTDISLKIEKRSLTLAEKSLARKRNALKNRTISADDVDKEERNVLTQRQNVQNLQNTLVVFPSRKKALEARLVASQAGLKQAQLDLSKTVITAPFDCRIGEVSLEPGQYLNVSQMLFEAHSTAVTEIQAQIVGDQLRHLIGQIPASGLMTPAEADIVGMRKPPNLKAIVRLRSGDWNVAWAARFDRFRESVDPETRAFNVVVAVDNPYEKVIPGQRPPLSRGLFCEVELQGQILSRSIVIPRAALHDGTVYIVDTDQRLQPVKVTSAFAQGNLIVIETGLTGGEMLVVSDPTPAIVGMLVAPIRDTSLEDRLLAEATAETEL